MRRNRGGGHSGGGTLRRVSVLDKLVDAASNAEAEVREEFTVEDILIEEGCATGIRDHRQGWQARHRACSRGSSERRSYTHSLRAVRPSVFLNQSLELAANAGHQASTAYQVIELTGSR